jgi:hypothetical protein
MRLRCFSAALAICAGLSIAGSNSPSADELISFDDLAGQRLLAQNFSQPGLGRLLHYFESQIDQSFCGVASSVIVLNSLDVPSPVSANWYPYRKFDQSNFFTEQVLALKSAKKVGTDGLTMEELAAALRTHGVKVETIHANSLAGVEAMRSNLVAALANPNERVIVNYLRDSLGQKGGGHFSPIAAFDTATDRFLILDVARYKLPPVWSASADLWAAINTVDFDAGQKRGLLIVSR